MRSQGRAPGRPWHAACSRQGCHVRPPAPDVVAVTVAAAGIRARAHRLSDGRTLLLVLSRTPRNLAELVGGWQSRNVQATSTPLPHGGIELRLIAPFPLVDHRLKQVGRDWRMVISFANPARDLRARVRRRVPAGVPSTFTARRFLPVETQMQRGRISEAVRLLATYEEEPSLEPWARLRAADIALIKDSGPAACEEYAALVAEYPSRTAGLLARLRAELLACDAATSVPLPWRNILGRITHTPGAVGRFLNQELKWSLGWLCESESIEQLLALLPNGRSAAAMLPRPLADVLRARALRFAPSAYERAKVYLRHRDDFESHPEAASLKLLAARSLIDLDLVDQALPILDALVRHRGRGALWRERMGRAQASALLIHVHRQRGDHDMARRISRRHLRSHKDLAPPTESASERVSRSPTAVEQTLAGLAERLDAIDAAVTRLTRSRHGFAYISTGESP